MSSSVSIRAVLGLPLQKQLCHIIGEVEILCVCRRVCLVEINEQAHEKRNILYTPRNNYRLAV